MKKYLYPLLIALCGVFTLGSCSDDDDEHVITPDAIQAAFKALYPNITGADWEIKSTYYVAEFHTQGTETEVWFDKDAQWCMTEIDYNKNTALLPTAVQSALKNSNYGTWYIDDISKYERKDITFYVIEVETKGQIEHYLFYGEDGELIKDSTEKGSDDIFPFTPVP